MIQVRRRHFPIAIAGPAALCLPALAQQEQRVRRIGYFIVDSEIETWGRRIKAAGIGPQ